MLCMNKATLIPDQACNIQLAAYLPCLAENATPLPVFSPLSSLRLTSTY